MIVSIINSDGKLLYLALLEAITVLPIGQVIIYDFFTGENPDNLDVLFNFETQQFYLKND